MLSSVRAIRCQKREVSQLDRWIARPSSAGKVPLIGPSWRGHADGDAPRRASVANLESMILSALLRQAFPSSRTFFCEARDTAFSRSEAGTRRARVLGANRGAVCKDRGRTGSDARQVVRPPSRGLSRTEPLSLSQIKSEHIGGVDYLI